MAIRDRSPAGPRGRIGAAAEDAAAEYLEGLGWTVLARNLRVGRSEIDIVALEPVRRPVIVVVEVRSRSGPAFGAAVESIDGAKVARLYRAALVLRGGDGLPVTFHGGRLPRWRVDLLAMHRSGAEPFSVARHLRGLAPP